VIVGVISDTHIRRGARTLPTTLVNRLSTVDLILHAGDFTTVETLDFLRTLAPVQAVYGNVDDLELKTILPKTREIRAGAFRIGLVHGDGIGYTTIERARRAFDGVDCIVFGHSHSPTIQHCRSVLMVNPGSPTDSRMAPRPSYAILRIDAAVEAEIIHL
jgi:uncharacterized protein